MNKTKIFLAFMLLFSVVPTTLVNVKAEENEEVIVPTFEVDSEAMLEQAIAAKEAHITIIKDIEITKTHKINYDVTIIGREVDYYLPVLSFVGSESAYAFEFTNNKSQIGDLKFVNGKGGVLITDANVTLIGDIRLSDISETGIMVHSLSGKESILDVNEKSIDYYLEVPSIIAKLNKNLVKVVNESSVIEPKDFIVEGELHYFYYDHITAPEYAVRDGIIANMYKFSGDDYSFKANYWPDRHAQGISHIIDFKTKTLSVDSVAYMITELILANDNIHSFKLGGDSKRLYIKNNPNFTEQLKIEVQKQVDSNVGWDSIFYAENGASFGFYLQYWEVDIEKDKVILAEALDKFVNNSGYSISFNSGGKEIVVHNEAGFDVDSKVDFIMDLLDSLDNVYGFLLGDDVFGEYIYFDHSTVEESRQYIYDYFTKTRSTMDKVLLTIRSNDNVLYPYTLGFTAEAKVEETPEVPVKPEEPKVPETPKTPEVPKVDETPKGGRVPTGIENTTIGYSTIIAGSLLLLLNIRRKKLQ